MLSSCNVFSWMYSFETYNFKTPMKPQTLAHRAGALGAVLALWATTRNRQESGTRVAKSGTRGRTQE